MYTNFFQSLKALNALDNACKQANKPINDLLDNVTKLSKIMQHVNLLSNINSLIQPYQIKAEERGSVLDIIKSAHSEIINKAYSFDESLYPVRVNIKTDISINFGKKLSIAHFDKSIIINYCEVIK